MKEKEVKEKQVKGKQVKGKQVKGKQVKGHRLKAGLLVNPLAGLGGAVALKGSDGVAELALSLGAKSRVAERVRLFLDGLYSEGGVAVGQIDWLAGPGVMGADYFSQGCSSGTHLPKARIIGDETIAERDTTAADTEDICQLMLAEGIDLLVFAGGDGTARNLVNVENPGSSAPIGWSDPSPAFSSHPPALSSRPPALSSRPPALSSPPPTPAPPAHPARPAPPAPPARPAPPAHPAPLTPPVVLGIPCGVKMHSAVFATSPASASHLVQKLLKGEVLSVIQGEVRDIDEAALRQQQVNARYYGELPVPDDLRYLQQTKVGGLESDELVMEEIAADLRDHLQGKVCLMGAGTTIGGVMASLGIDNTLLGVDAVRDGKLLGSDLAEADILRLIRDEPAVILVSFTGGQGYLFGRGNQQLSAEVIRAVGPEQIMVLATKAKLKALEGRPLLVDTGDRALDEKLSGLIRIRTGYEDEVLYLVEAA